MHNTTPPPSFPSILEYASTHRAMMPIPPPDQKSKAPFNGWLARTRYRNIISALEKRKIAAQKQA
jgi:hypothetical protein